jgi:nitrilase
MNKVAAIQMTSSSQLADNLSNAAHWLAEAKRQGVVLAVLPENFALMAQNSEQLFATQEKFGHGPIQDFLAHQAKQHHLWIAAGTVPLSHSSGKVSSACLVFSNQGVCVARYDKMHLFDVVIIPDKEEHQESARITPGQEIVVADSPLGKLGMAICYDVRFPELFRQLLLRGAEIFILPSAFTVPTGSAHWQVLLRARAIENGCYVVAAAQTGTHDNGRKTYGHSMIIDPWGKVLNVLESGEGVITAEIDLDYLQEVRRKLPMQQHMKLLS